MNSASQPDTPSEWSKFAPLPPRLRSNSELSETENLAAVDPSSETVSASPIASNNLIVLTSAAPDDGTAAVAVVAHPTDQFVCQNRKCQERRVKRGQTPRPLFSAHWRNMKIGKRQTLVLELAVRCGDCDFEHRATLVPPEWLDVK